MAPGGTCFDMDGTVNIGMRKGLEREAEPDYEEWVGFLLRGDLLAYGNLARGRHLTHSWMPKGDSSLVTLAPGRFGKEFSLPRSHCPAKRLAHGVRGQLGNFGINRSPGFGFSLSHTMLCVIWRL